MAAMDIEMASPVGPMVAVPYPQHHEFGIPAYHHHSDVDLCQLLQAMSLTKAKLKVPEVDRASVDVAVPRAPSQIASERGAGTEDPAYLSDASESSSSNFTSSDQQSLVPAPSPTPVPDSAPALAPSPSPTPAPIPACHFLQSILASLVPDSPILSPSPYPYPAMNAFQTTNGTYLDTLLIHRHLLAAFPPAHAGCELALNTIADAIEARTWQADRDADAEAVVALREEAYIVAHWV